MFSNVFWFLIEKNNFILFLQASTISQVHNSAAGAASVCYVMYLICQTLISYRQLGNTKVSKCRLAITVCSIASLLLSILFIWNNFYCKCFDFVWFVSFLQSGKNKSIILSYWMKIQLLLKEKGNILFLLSDFSIYFLFASIFRLKLLLRELTLFA